MPSFISQNKIILIWCLMLSYFIETGSVLGYNRAVLENEIVKGTGMLKECNLCPAGIKCVPQISCPAHVRLKPHEKPQNCDLPNGDVGYCCSTGRNHTINNAGARAVHFHKIKPSIIEEARKKFAALSRHYPKSAIQKGDPEFFHNILFHSSPHDIRKTHEWSNSAMEQILASQIFKEKEHIRAEEFEMNNVEASFKLSPLGRHCPHVPACPNLYEKYRSIDGSCNNVFPGKSVFGAAGQPMERLLPPAYEDGIWMSRMHSVDGSQLTGARETSRMLLPDVDRPHPQYNLLLMQFGQFITHDVTRSSSFTTATGEPIQCCSQDGSSVLPSRLAHFACMAIPIEPHDEFYRIFNQGCMNFVRLSLAPSKDCKVGYGKQVNQVTSFLDASTVYGSDHMKLNELRSFHGGKLRMFYEFGRYLLPMSTSRESCNNSPENGACFVAGDGRVNQIISLVVLHTIFAREHNRVAGILGKLNPHLTDEELFQEARRIVIAEIQHITYKEWLPLSVGPSTMVKFGLKPKLRGYANDYDPHLNPAVTNEFSGAAFRFGHSTVAGRFYIQRNHSLKEAIDISEVMFNPNRLRKITFLDDLVRTLIQQPMQMVDNAVSFGMSRFLFRGNNPFGLDIGALNIQRGRDHGLRSYNDYLEVLGHRRINFSDFNSTVSAKLSQVYKHPDDIDLWIGGLLESARKGALVGSTFAEIITEQFARFRYGDRYYYEYSPEINPGHFTPDQLQELRKVTMARIICDNLDGFGAQAVPPHAFIRADIKRNAPISCDSKKIPTLDLRAWKD